MKILYAARMGRFDLLRPVTALGSRIATWTKLCVQRLHRLVCYIKTTVNMKMYGWIETNARTLNSCYTVMLIWQAIAMMPKAHQVSSCVSLDPTLVFHW